MASSNFEKCKADKSIQERYANDQEGIIPPGRYECHLQDAQIVDWDEKLKSGGTNPNWCIVLEHYIRKGEQTGEVLYQRLYPVAHKPFLRRLAKEAIRAFNFEPPAYPSEFEELIAALRNRPPVYIVQAKANGSFPPNCAIVELISAKAEGVAAKPKAKPEPAPESTSAFTVGSDVSFIMDGETYEGTVEGMAGDKYIVAIEMEDGSIDRYDCGEADLTAVEAEAEADDTNRVALIAFAQAQELDPSEEATVDELVAQLNDYEWDEAKLVTSEVELLQANGIAYTAKVKKKKAKKKTK